MPTPLKFTRCTVEQQNVINEFVKLASTTNYFTESLVSDETKLLEYFSKYSHRKELYYRNQDASILNSIRLKYISHKKYLEQLTYGNTYIRY